jgi:hypothetical protein
VERSVEPHSRMVCEESVKGPHSELSEMWMGEEG